MTIRTSFRHGTIIILSVFLLALPMTALAMERLIANVYISGETLDLSGDAAVRISYELPKPGMSTITLWNSDFVPVRQLVSNNDSRGLNTVYWDGVSQQGEKVPNGAYFLTIHAKLSDTSTAIYDPTLNTGGEAVPISTLPDSHNPRTGMITFTLPGKSTVRLRAGLTNGPVYSTIIDWQALSSGHHEINWDGMSDDGIVYIGNASDLTVTLEAQTLPDNSIIIKNSPTNAGMLSPDTAMAASSGVDMSFPPRPYYLIQNKLKPSPPFSLTINNTTPSAAVIPVSGQVRLRVDTDPTTLEKIISNRFELVVFVDDRRFDEIEYAYMPLTYMLNTESLTAGEHLVTLNLFTISGQRTARSAKINLLKD